MTCKPRDWFKRQYPPLGPQDGGTFTSPWRGRRLNHRPTTSPRQAIAIARSRPGLTADSRRLRAVGAKISAHANLANIVGHAEDDHEQLQDYAPQGQVHEEEQGAQDEQR